MNNLKNKNILFISPKFFDYDRAIHLTLENRGANITRIYDRPFENVLLQGVTKLFTKIISRSLNLYYINKLKKINKKIDIVFVINGQTITKKVLKFIENKWPNAHKVLYIWDSLENRPTIIDTLQFYSRKFSFERNVCKLYNLEFRPLFFYEEKKITLPIYNTSYLLSFVGTAHSDRFIILKKIMSQFSNKKIYCFLYLKAKWLYWLYKIFDNNYKTSKLSDYSFQPLSHQKYLEIINNSKILIDIQHPKQTGLTIRTIEFLYSKKKFITTNKDVKNYNFYKYGNIEIIDRNNPKINRKFINKNFTEYDEDILNYYSIDSFIDTCLS